MSRKPAVDANAPAIILVDLNESPPNAGWFDRATAKAARKLADHYKCHVFSGDQVAVKDVADRIQQGRVDDDRLSLASVSAEVAEELRRLVEPPASQDEAAAHSTDPDDVSAMAADLAQADRDGLGNLSEQELGAVQDALPGDPTFAVSGSADASEVALTSSGNQGSGSLGESAASGTAINLRDPSSDSSAASDSDAWSRLSVGALVLAADLDKKGEPDCWYEAIIVRITPATFILRFRDYPRDGLLARTRRHVALLHPAP